ncbi:MAG: serine protease [Phycisphaerae bacterium]|nr:serine protease [Phycisphaerae bacterium]
MIDLHRFPLVVLPLMLFSAVGIHTVNAGGFADPIAEANARVVKLYGLGAGLQAGYGTGILVSSDGLVLTVESLLIDARSVLVVDSAGRRFDADVVKRDSPRQLALLKIRSLRDGDPAEAGVARDNGTTTELGPFEHYDLRCEGTGESACHAPLLPGDWLIVAGNAFKVADGPEPVSIAHGVLSARVRLDARRQLRDFPYTGEVLVIDAITSNPGAPGSAVVNLDGELVGMVGRGVISNRTATHLNYAMPRAVLWDFFREATGVESESKKEAIEHWSAEAMGLHVHSAGYRKVLPFIEHVRRDSPAARAGIRADDLILSVNNFNLPDADTLEARIADIPMNEAVEVVLRRGRSIRTVRVVAQKEAQP